MIFYHFCADKHIKKILREGLTIGAVTEPTKTGYLMHTGWIWLTTDPDARHQSWATSIMIPYSRTEWRITIDIPDEALDRIYDRKRLSVLYPTSTKLFDGWSGSENWRVYKGQIPKTWFKGHERSRQ